MSCTQAIWGLGGTVGEPKNGCGFPVTPSSVSGDVSRDGIRDLGGSLEEWVFSSPRVSAVGPSSLPDDFVGPHRTLASRAKVLRGGSFTSVAAETQALTGSERTIGFSAPSVGFRCARTKL